MPAVTARPSSPVRSRTGTAVMVLSNLVAGPPVYFVAFLFSYGFRDVLGPQNHLAFVAAVGVLAVVTGLLGAAADAAATSRPFRRSATIVVPGSLSLNALVLAAGSVVSAMHKHDGSVSQDFSTSTDVLVAGGLLVLAVAFALTAARARRRG
ncbi:hypothetical protein [Nocardioides marmoraquaticus]